MEQVLSAVHASRQQGHDSHCINNFVPALILRLLATGNRDIVALLVEKGAELDAPSESGTPLMWAAGSGHSEVVTELLESGADPNAQAPNGATAMILAAVAGTQNRFSGPCFPSHN